MEKVCRLGWYTLFVAMAGDILLSLVLPCFYKEYSSMKMSISALGNFFNVNESKDTVTTASKIHGAGSVIGFMLFLFVPLLMAILSFKSKESGIGIVGIICFVIALAFFILFVMSDKPGFSNTIINNEGLWERLNLIFMYVPLFVASIRQIIRG